MELKIFQMLDFINNRLSNLEKNIARMEEKLDFGLALQRNHLIRVKNGEDIDDSIILMGRPYNDLSPQKALKILNDKNADYILLDVSDESFVPSRRPNETVCIPLEELPTRYIEIANKTTPIIVISEDGLKSILACELLVKKGHYNVNNISGGYAYLSAHRKDSIATKNP